MRRLPAPAKVNLALVVGPAGPGGKHEVTTVLQRVDLADRIALEPAPRLRVSGFVEDTLVARALALLAEAAGVEPRWAVRISKRLPVAAGLAGGSSDAATALRLANETIDRPLALEALRELAASLGADVPFFLAQGPQLGEGDGSVLTPLDLPQDYWVLLLLPEGALKPSTAAVYAAFDERGGERGYGERRSRLLAAVASVCRPRDLAELPPNDLASSSLADELRALGAFRADVTGTGPVVYGLFHHRREAVEARRLLRGRGRSWLTVPAWYVWPMSQPAVQSRPTRSSRSWLGQRRLKIALAIAVVEGIVVAIEKDFSRWTVIIVAAPIIAFYLFAGRALNSETGRQLSWTAAASQAFAALLAILALMIQTFVLVIAGVFAIIALVLILADRPRRT